MVAERLARYRGSEYEASSQDAKVVGGVARRIPPLSRPWFWWRVRSRPQNCALWSQKSRDGCPQSGVTQLTATNPYAGDEAPTYSPDGGGSHSTALARA